MLRKFEELITEIEHDGERFVPIEEIAKLAVSHRNFFKDNIAVESSFNKKNNTHNCIVTSSSFVIKLFVEIEKFNVNLYEVYEGNILYSMPFYNQVLIVKNLIKWGFVEP